MSLREQLAKRKKINLRKKKLKRRLIALKAMEKSIKKNITNKINQTTHCPKCLKFKTEDQILYYTTECKACKQARRRYYYLKDQEVEIKRTQEWNKKNKEKKNKRDAEWLKKNYWRPHVRDRILTYRKEQRDELSSWYVKDVIIKLYNRGGDNASVKIIPDVLTCIYTHKMAINRNIAERNKL